MTPKRFPAFTSTVLLLLLLHRPFLPCSAHLMFGAQIGYLCIRPEFARNIPDAASLAQCCVSCAMTANCQAFSLADGPCQLFVFDKCSKSVRDCSCSRRGQVFVKQQPGLEAGALCPSGYGDDLCGVKYKLHSGVGDWRSSRQKCESESGLVIMADVLDAETEGSPEPAGGWYWVGCNITLDGSLWASGEPNNDDGENVVGRWWKSAKLNDFIGTDSLLASAVLCECLSPFE